jgi:hypothetical protein
VNNLLTRLLVENDASIVGSDLKQALQALGGISLKAYWVTAEATSKETTKSDRGLLDIERIPEKVLKGRAVSHRIRSAGCVRVPLVSI